MFNGLLGAVFTPFAHRTVHIGTFGLGVGGLIGSLFSGAARPPLRRRAGRDRVTHAAAPALVGVVLAPASNVVVGGLLLGIGQFLVGLSVGLSNANEMGYRQIVTPDGLQCRTNGTMRSLNRGALVIGGPAGGLLAARSESGQVCGSGWADSRWYRSRCRPVLFGAPRSRTPCPPGTSHNRPRPDKDVLLNAGQALD